jgi:hypothetical protein
VHVLPTEGWTERCYVFVRCLSNPKVDLNVHTAMMLPDAARLAAPTRVTAART